MKQQLEYYVEAVIPNPYRVLGVELRPFSIGHIWLMKRFNCAFAEENPNATGNIMHFFLAAAICARKFDEFLQFISSETELIEWLNEWFNAVYKKSKQDHSYLIEEFHKFKRYMQESVELPLYFESDSDSDDAESGAHWTVNIVSALTSEGSRYSEKELIDLPLTKVIADYFKLLESRNLISLMRDDEIELIKSTEKQQEVAA